jgi:hypothetical protein
MDPTGSICCVLVATRCRARATVACACCVRATPRPRRDAATPPAPRAARSVLGPRSGIRPDADASLGPARDASLSTCPSPVRDSPAGCDSCPPPLPSLAARDRGSLFSRARRAYPIRTPLSRGIGTSGLAPDPDAAVPAPRPVARGARGRLSAFSGTPLLYTLTPTMSSVLRWIGEPAPPLPRHCGFARQETNRTMRLRAMSRPLRPARARPNRSPPARR